MRAKEEAWQRMQKDVASAEGAARSAPAPSLTVWQPLHARRQAWATCSNLHQSLVRCVFENKCSILCRPQKQRPLRQTPKSSWRLSKR